MMNIADVSSINDAMRMRDIRFGGKNAGKMIEYRMIPLLVCSARIGEELNAAAITRGLGGDVKRTNVCQIGFHIQDYVLILVCAVPYLIFSNIIIPVAVHCMIFLLIFIKGSVYCFVVIPAAVKLLLQD